MKIILWQKIDYFKMLTKNMIASLEELLPFKDNIALAAQKFGKSERTIRRWFQSYGIYSPQKKYVPGKVDKRKAAQIRRLERLEDCLTQKAIGEMFGISQSMVGKILNNQAHKTNLEIGGSAKATLFTSEHLTRNDNETENGQA